MSTVSDVSLMKRISLYDEEEDIEVKPPTELIPDEYKHNTNDEILVHVFISSDEDQDTAHAFLDALNAIEYNIDPNNNIHFVQQSESFYEKLEKIKAECRDKTALVLLFVGVFRDEGTFLLHPVGEHVEVKNIWSYFSSDKCPELQYKPKIFIFCGTKIDSKTVQTDSAKHFTTNYNEAYDFPAESDLLIIYKRMEGRFMLKQRNKFFTDLCDFIKQSSSHYDIIDLISLAQNNQIESVPLIISTLTRKFYFTPSNHREHQLMISENMTNLENGLEKIKERVNKWQEIQAKPKKKRSFFSSKRKTEEKPKIVVKPPQVNQKQKESQLTETKASTSTLKPRTRNTSVSSDFDRGRKTAVITKPRWKW